MNYTMYKHLSNRIATFGRTIIWTWFSDILKIIFFKYIKLTNKKLFRRKFMSRWWFRILKVAIFKIKLLKNQYFILTKS